MAVVWCNSQLSALKYAFFAPKLINAPAHSAYYPVASSLDEIVPDPKKLLFAVTGFALCKTSIAVLNVSDNATTKDMEKVYI